MKESGNIELWESMIILGFMLLFAVLSRLFIFSFKLIPLTTQTGGDELFYAFVGGVALAFSAPTLPLLVLYLTILFTAVKAPYELTRGRRIVLMQASLFLLAFASVFIIGISGVPILIANSLYKGKEIINIIGGILIGLHCGFRVHTFGKEEKRAPVIRGSDDWLHSWSPSLPASGSVLRFCLFPNWES